VKVNLSVDIYRHAGHKDADKTNFILEKDTPNVTLIEQQGDDFHLTWPGEPVAEVWVYSGPGYVSLELPKRKKELS
jgi:hypothetical protein